MSDGPRLALILVVLALQLPFIFQPFHIDDRVYLEIADNALENPLFPYDYSPLFEGILTPDAASHSHLPLLSYYLAAVKLLTGNEQSWVFHLAFLIFPIILAVSFYGLASRYVRRPFLATLLLVGSPGVVVLSHTLMSEVPLLALWVLVIDRTLSIVETGGQARDWVVLILGLSAAAFMTILSFGLVLIVAVICLLEGRVAGSRRVEWRWILLCLTIPVFIWGLWYLRGYLHYDRFLLVRTVQHLDKRASFSLLLMGTKGLSFLLCAGGAAFFPLLPLAGLRGRWVSLVGTLAGALAGGYQFVVAGWSLFHSLLFSILLAAGIVVILGCLQVLVGRDLEAVMGSRAQMLRYLLLLWLVGIFLAAVFVYPSGSVRYVLLAFPPLILAFQWASERKGQLSRQGWTLSVVATLVFSLTLGWADYTMASEYKQEARQLVQDYREPERTVWFTGEWGFRYYLQQEGAQILSRVQVDPQAGDILIKPVNSFPYRTLYDGMEHLLFLEQRSIGPYPYLLLMDFRSHAGFYSTHWGLLPYSLSLDEPWETFYVFWVLKRYDGPIPEPEKHY